LHLLQSSYTILVVDDSADIRHMIRFTLEALGQNVVEAPDGESAVLIAEERRPDLILMDLSMPGLDGFGATSAIRHLPSMAAVPIIAISAHTTPDHRKKALAVGFNDFLAKPLDFFELDNSIKHWLSLVITS
jgi:CheY-like chemotaxis protein